MRLREYADAISLYTSVSRPEIISRKDELISTLNKAINFLSNEQKSYSKIPLDLEEKKKNLRGLLNQRMPGIIPNDISLILDRILWTERVEKGIVELKETEAVWRGDITQLQVDAIVNAANSDMLGCFHPLHACIDNAIHSAAGPQLREDCHKIMKLQGIREQTGCAKITKAHNLPSKYVVHTVGPIVESTLSEKHRSLLASSYKSCLDLASNLEDIRSIAFCCISTGVFGYPKEEAAITAIKAVREWKKENPDRFDRIIFNVFTEKDYDIYKRHI
ncbi:protein-ADP-ribose hydrolase [Oceanispirochaeta crateris]|uniref:Protein-ADP-ribose hydrolase n=1 Tax=Oceanispirochaeta crateris TaxID=2518645 RepID=A0A5C1QJB8_9SPIO|nr:protein-ADP-ribose hydrolase [Oceanispirochaeta crateris]QEN08243.1 protein-ADP-ribose hydrolase [Oceanispirochaeta crateris]